MSDSSFNLPPPPLPPLPPESSIAATPAGQRVQSWGNRAWRAFGATPWWRLVAGGLIVIIGTLLLAVPFDSIRMANKIRSQAAKEALRTSLQHEVLERARGGLLVARSLAVGDEQVAEIDSAIADIDREIAKPVGPERFEGSLNELRAKIDQQRAKRDTAMQRLNETAIKLAQSKQEKKTDLAEKIREIADEIESLNETIVALEEQRAEKDAERAELAAERATREAELAAERTARKAELDAERAAREAELAAERAARDSELAAERAAREAERAAETAARNGVAPKAPNAPKTPAAPSAPTAPKSPQAPIKTSSRSETHEQSTVTTIGVGGSALKVTVADGKVKVSASDGKEEAAIATIDVSKAAPTVKATSVDGDATKLNVDLFGRKVFVVDDAKGGVRSVGAFGFQPDEPSAALIRETISRDSKKFIAAGTATLVLTVLFFFMLVARSFAGRAARGEQRAVIAESRERTESHARQLAEARLTLMRAQVEPHFLFNTLAHVQALQEIDPPQASTMLERLISYLRAAMPSMRETKSTLGREVDVVRAYLDLLKIRMGDRLRYFINMPADMNGVSLPPTMIATLVENAIKHGLEPKKEGGSIAVQVRKLEATEAHPERMEVLVADDGLGFGAADTSGTGVGLANTRERLKMLYGSSAELAVEPNAPSGVRAIIRVPLVVPETIDDTHEDEFVEASPDSVSPFAIQVTILLAVCFGWLGVHRFYVDLKRSALAQAALGILSIITGGLAIFLAPLVLWVVLDVVWIATREFRDGNGRRIVRLRAKDAPVDPASLQTPGASSAHVSPFTLNVTAPLALFLGVLGVHRFYVGRYRTGALQTGLFALSIITGGLPIFLLPLVMWVVLDVAWILSRDFRDANGRRIMRRDAKDKRSYSATQMANRRRDPSVSKSSRGIALLLAIVLGIFGAHRFYVGRVGTGLAMLFTLGGLGIWWLVDIVMVACGQLKDMDGKWVSEWE
jgi:TM2 domain-containing membrane protein YozV